MIRRALRLAVSLPRRLFRVGLYAAALAAGGFLAAGVFGETVTGSGKSITEDRDVGPVTEVVLSGTSTLKVIAGDTPSLTVTADDNVLPLLETETTGNQLCLTTRSGYSIRTKTPVVYTLTVPRLEKLSISGSGSAAVSGASRGEVTVKLSGSGNVTWENLACKSLTLTVSGSGRATAAGTTERLVAKVTGSGDVSAAELQARTGEVSVSGSGTVTVWAADQLTARVSGSGDIKYKGSPKLDKKASGSGRVKPFGE